MKKYTGIYWGMTDIQVAIVRAQYVSDHSEGDLVDEAHAEKVFDVCLAAGIHPVEATREALIDEIDWSKQEALDNSVDQGGQ